MMPQQQPTTSRVDARNPNSNHQHQEHHSKVSELASERRASGMTQTTATSVDSSGRKGFSDIVLSPMKYYKNKSPRLGKNGPIADIVLNNPLLNNLKSSPQHRHQRYQSCNASNDSFKAAPLDPPSILMDAPVSFNARESFASSKALDSSVDSTASHKRFHQIMRSASANLKRNHSDDTAGTTKSNTTRRQHVSLHHRRRRQRSAEKTTETRSNEEDVGPALPPLTMSTEPGYDLVWIKAPGSRKMHLELNIFRPAESPAAATTNEAAMAASHRMLEARGTDSPVTDRGNSWSPASPSDHHGGRRYQHAGTPSTCPSSASSSSPCSSNSRNHKIRLVDRSGQSPYSRTRQSPRSPKQTKPVISQSFPDVPF